MNEGYIIFVSADRFPGLLKMISSEIDGESFVQRLNSSAKYSYRLKKEITIPTDSNKSRIHNLEEILIKYQYSPISDCSTITKDDLEFLLIQKGIPFL